jgi:NDP-sugar pyrophosphorylase family protein
MSRSLFPVVILAGGLATRLRPITQHVPKSMVEVHGEPFIAHQLRLLRRQGVHEVVLCVGHLGEQIIDAVGDGEEFGLSVQYSFDGPRLLGTGGALRQALPKVSGLAFFVLYGDSYLECDYEAVQAAFVDSGKLALMTVCRNDTQWDASNVEWADGHILTYDKQNRTPRMKHIDYGLGVFARQAFERTPAKEPWDLAELYQDLLRRKQLAAFEASERFFEIGSPAGLAETRKYLGERGVSNSDCYQPGAPATERPVAGAPG